MSWDSEQKTPRHNSRGISRDETLETQLRHTIAHGNEKTNLLNVVTVEVVTLLAPIDAGLLGICSISLEFEPGRHTAPVLHAQLSAQRQSSDAAASEERRLQSSN
jgi:hypothetical protein